MLSLSSHKSPAVLTTAFVLSILCCLEAVAGENSFGRVLPTSGYDQGPFHADMPLSEGRIQSGGHISAPEAFFESDSLQSQAPLAADTSSSSAPAAGLDRPKAWYKFLEPSLNLARSLEESERKRLLSIVPVPLNLLSARPQSSDSRVALLRAGAAADYACFKTICGNLFARSNALLLVVSSSKTVRVLNISAKEKDLLFKLANGQVITIGPGSELIVAKHLLSTDLLAQDNIARRGFTPLMKCSDMSMVFCQFSYESALQTPELKYFIAHQSPDYQKTLKAKIASINEIRGIGGFRSAVEQQALQKKLAYQHSSSKNTRAGQKKAEAERPLPADKGKNRADLIKQIAESENAQASKNLAKTESASQEKAKQLAAQEKAKQLAAQEKAKQLAAQQKAKQLAAQEKAKQLAAQEKAKQLAAKEKAKQLAEEKSKKAAQERARQIAAEENERQAGQEKQFPAAAAAKSFNGKLKDLAFLKQPKEASKKSKQGATETGRVLSKKPEQVSSEPLKALLPRKLPGPDTPPDIAKLLLDADKEEKLAYSFKKKADKCISFAESGLMNPEQQGRMMLEAKRHLRDARAAEERCQTLRRQAEIATNGKSPL